MSENTNETLQAGAPAAGASHASAEPAARPLSKTTTDPDQVREIVREGYTEVVERVSGCCGSAASHAEEVSRKIGYSDEDLAAIPEGANLGVGCGNPTAIDALRPGEVVVDLGSGAGMDAFLAAGQVGSGGRVIGVDMTDAMLAQARKNAESAGVTNVEFRKGNIEELPVEDESVDVILSNCVINLSPEKDKVYREAYRVLKPGGRVMVSDIVIERELPELLRESIEAYVGCVGGASLRSVYLQTIEDAGFSEVRVEREGNFNDLLSESDPQVQEAMKKLDASFEEIREMISQITSLHIFARK